MPAGKKPRGRDGAPRDAGQFRIIGGEWRRRRLSFPARRGVRPTGDRVRETLFNWLQPVIVGARCLDLFAGSGALGLEALSRGAAHVTAVLPYLTYARQDKPTRDHREPTSARLMADLALEAGIDRLVTVHPHIAHLPGFYGRIRVDAISPLPYLVDAFQELRGRSDAIVVAPDVGASKLVADAAQALGLPAAIAVKARPRAEEAVTAELIGSFEGRRVALVLDDMIASGGTVRALLRRLAEETEVREVHLGVSHNLGLDIARERLLELQADYGLVDVVVTDSVPQTEAFLELPFLRVVELADVLARTLNRIHHDRPVSSLVREPEATADRVEPVG
ncbi:MAG: ribose-phosphate diphosphokinase [Deinococcales bacterium]